MGGERFDYFVSHAGADRAWAEWVAWQLIEAGYTVELGVWDWAAGRNFVTAMSDALERCDRVVALFSAAYFDRSRYTTEEWTTAVIHVAGMDNRLVPVRVEEVPAAQVPAVLRPLVFRDLFGVAEEQARQILLEAVAEPRRPDRKPAFPGHGRPGAMSRLGRSRPRLPGPMPPAAGRSAGLSAICNLPPRNPDFIGRGRSLAALRRGVARGPVAVHGLGGIGKTQLALEFAHLGFIEGRYTIVWWVRAESALTLAEDLAALAPGVGVPVAADQAEIHAGVRAALAQRDSWLLVFDNAPDAAAVRAWLPTGAGHTVITSRDSGWGGLATRVDVQEFTRPESVAYLQRRGRRQEPTEADALADMLGDLPLALAQAAAYLDLHGGLSIARYLQLYQNEQSAGQLLAAGMDGYPHSVATTWLIHFQKLADGLPAALQLLRLCAHLDPDDINLNLLLSRPDLLAGPLTGVLAGEASDPGRREDTIGALARTGLITRLDGGSRIRLHRLIAQVIRHQLAITKPRRGWLGRRRGTETHWANHATAILYELFPTYPWDPACWPVAADLAAHVSATVDIATRHSPATGVAGKLLNKLGLYLTSRGEDAVGQATQQRAVAILEAVYGPDDFYVARALTDLATVQKQLGDPAAAVASQERALAIFEALASPDDPLVAGALGNLGIVQRQAGDLSAARISQERALAIFEAVYGPDHPEVATVLGNLGNLQRQLGDLNAARDTLQRALDISEATDGPSRTGVALVLGHLGNLQRQAGDLSAARTSHERSLAILEPVYGPDHPEVAIVLGRLGTVQNELGEFDAARTSLQRALDIMQLAHGPNHPQTVSARSVLNDLTG